MLRPGIPALLGLLTLLAWAAPAAAQDGAYGVAAGDQLTIDFYTAAGDRINEIAGDRTIDGEGNIFLPYVGTVSVQGMDAPAIRRRLAQLYVDYYDDPVVDVEVRMRISVTGAVRSPGTFYLDPTTTLLQAVAEAGGESLSQGGTNVINAGSPDLTQVRLVRSDSTEVVNLQADAADATRDFDRIIQSGDWIYVPRISSGFNLRENVTFWGQVATLALTVAIFISQVGGN